MILKTSKTVPDRLETAPPAIGKGGNWWAYDDKTGKFTDTGVKAKGDKGDPGMDGTSQYTKTTVDTRGLDPDTYYPVTFKITKVVVCDFLLKKDLDIKTADWQTHTFGFTIDYGWEDSTEKWGAGLSVRLIHRARYQFTTDNVIPAGNIGQTSQTNECYIYVRGGGVYPFLTSYRNGEPGPPAILHDKEYTVTINDKFTFTLPLKTSVTMPETERKRLERLQNEKANELRAALDNANTLIEGLSTIRDEIRNGTVEPRKFQDIQYLLDALQKDGSFKTGILLSSVIALSGKDGAITSYLSGARGDGIAMLRAGVENFGGAGGKPETAQTTVWSDGSVDIGDMHFVNEKDPEADHIDFTDKAENHTYLQIGGAPKTESEIIKEGSVPVEIELEPVYNKTDGTHLIADITNLEGSRTVTLAGTITAFAKASARRVEPLPGDPIGSIQYAGTYASVSAYVKVEVYSGETLKNTYTSNTLTAQAEVEGFTVKPTEIPPLDKMRKEISKELPFTLSVPIASAGERMSVTLIVTTTSPYPDYAFAQAGVKKGIKASSLSSNRKSLVSIMRDKVAFFFSRQKYLLFNYISDYLVKIVGNVLVQGTIKADYVDMPGTQICGAIFDKNGTEVKAFGKAKNKSGSSYASAGYDYNAREYTVYHSIGHTKYIPMVTVTDTKSARQLCVSDISSYSFKVIAYFSDYTQGQVGFSYIAFKAD